MRKVLLKVDEKFELYNEDEILDYDETIEEDYGDEDVPLEEIGEVDEDENLDEALKRKIIVRKGKRMKVKRSNKKGYTSRGGKEVKMSPAERRRRSKSQKRASKKRRSKKSQSSRKRARSLRKRGNL